MSRTPDWHPAFTYEDFIAAGGVGIGRKVAYALSILGLDVVQRSTIRALLPVGTQQVGASIAQQTRRQAGKTGQRKKNRTSKRFQDRLNQFEDWGWISKGHLLIAVHDRGSLLDHALQGEDVIHPRLLDLERAVACIRMDEAEADDDRLVEQRRRELLALMRLMQAPVTGANRSGTKSVRFVNRSRPI